MVTAHEIQELTGAQLIRAGRDSRHFIGRLYYLDYEKARALVSDTWQDRALGVPRGTFLLSYSDRDPDASEVLLLRALGPCPVPADDMLVRTMIEYYRNELEAPHGNEDGFPYRELSFSGLECRVLGTLFKGSGREGRETLEFVPETDGLRSPAGYTVYKPAGEVLEMVIRLRLASGRNTGFREFDIGTLRYRHRDRVSALDGTDVPVTVNPADFPGRITGIIGPESGEAVNVLLLLMEATESFSRHAEYDHLPETTFTPTIEPFNDSGAPWYLIGQVLFHAGQSSPGPEEDRFLDALFERGLRRFSLVEKPGHTLLRVNFYENVQLGFELVRSFLLPEDADYIRNFTQVDLSPPEDEADFGIRTRWARKRAAYLCCLYRAGFQPPPEFRVRFQGNNVLDSMVRSDGSIRPSEGITFQQAVNWFSTVWDNYHSEYFRSYQESHDGREWADEDLKALLVFLTRKRFPGGNAYVSGYRKLSGVIGLHSPAPEKPFQRSIMEEVRSGGSVMVDLSRGDPSIGRAFADIICREIFHDAMVRFIRGLPNNFIQFSFTGARDLFPHNGTPGGAGIFDRMAREGEKLRLGMVFLAPEASGIPESILNGVRNLFITHLPDARDLAASSIPDFLRSMTRRPMADGFGSVWMQTASSPYALPVRPHRFPSGMGVVPVPRVSKHRQEKTGIFPHRFARHRSTR